MARDILKKIGLKDDMFDRCFDYGYEFICNIDGQQTLCSSGYIRSLSSSEIVSMLKNKELTANLYICLKGIRSTAAKLSLFGTNSIESLKSQFVRNPYVDMRDTCRESLRDYYKEAVPDGSISMVDFYINVLVKYGNVEKGINDELYHIYLLNDWGWDESSAFKQAKSYCMFMCGQTPDAYDDEGINARNIDRAVRILKASDDDDISINKDSIQFDIDEDPFNSVDCGYLIGKDLDETFDESQSDSTDYIEKQLFIDGYIDNFQKCLSNVHEQVINESINVKDMAELRGYLNAMDGFGFNGDHLDVALDFYVDAELVAVEVYDGKMYVYGIYYSGCEPILFRSKVSYTSEGLMFDCDDRQCSVDKLDLYKLYNESWK